MKNKTLLDSFMESGKEVYEITQSEWVNIHENHMLECWKIIQEQDNIVFADLEQRLYNEYIESKLFHSQQVESALKNGIKVSKEVLKDYPDLIEKVKMRQEQIKQREEYLNSLPKLTQEIFNNINIGDKIKIDNYKVTVYKKEDNQLICKLYRSKTKGISLSIGDRGSIVVGW